MLVLLQLAEPSVCQILQTRTFGQTAPLRWRVHAYLCRHYACLFTTCAWRQRKYNSRSQEVLFFFFILKAGREFLSWLLPSCGSKECKWTDVQWCDFTTVLYTVKTLDVIAGSDFLFRCWAIFPLQKAISCKLQAFNISWYLGGFF